MQKPKHNQSLEGYIGIGKDTITLSVIPPNKFATAVLWGLLLTGVFVPVITTVVIVIFIGGLKPTIVFFYLIFWAVSAYFFRLISWNKSGKEVITKVGDEYHIDCKSNHIQFSNQTIGATNSTFYVVPTRSKVLSGTEALMGKLAIENPEKEIFLNVELPTDALENLVRTLNSKVE